jgi:hypothetical protein
MLSTYVNTLVAAGLPVVRMVEPVGDRPVWQAVPGLLYFRIDCDLRDTAVDAGEGRAALSARPGQQAWPVVD